MRENKHMMILFTGLPDVNHEITFCCSDFFNSYGGILKNAVDRLLIVKYEPREGTLVAYYLKDRSKRDQILRKLLISNQLLMGHISKFNKIVEKENGNGKPMEGGCHKCGEPAKEVVLVPNKAVLEPNKDANNLGARPKKEQKSRKDISPEKEKKTKSPPKEKKSKSPPKDESKSSSKDETRICWCCGKEPVDEVKLSKCGGCRKAWYCSESCQTTDWQEHGSYCTKMQEKLAKKKQAKKNK